MNSEPLIYISYEDDDVMLPLELEERIQELLTRIMVSSGFENKKVSLFFCGKQTIQQLNSEYRNIDKPTDILSWLYDAEEQIIEEEDQLWGELAVCLEICRQQADASDWPLETELLRLLVHGLVHLMGYDHEKSDAAEKEMLEIEKKFLSSIDLNGLYD